MSNIDNCEPVYKIDNCESVYKNERQILENEEEFIYTSINPFCETVVEQKLSKEKLKRILERGMQKSIPLAKVKQAREEIENEIKFWNGESTDPKPYTTEIRKAKANSYKHCLEILDRLIENET